MKRSFIGFLALVATLGPVSAQQGIYLYDALKKPAYKASWDGMLRGQRVDRWLARYSRAFDGPTVMLKEVSTGDGPRELGFVCKRHECGDNRFFVLFGNGGRRAVGVLAREGAPLRYLGAPTAAERTALDQAAK